MTAESLNPESIETRRQTRRAWKLAATGIGLVFITFAGILRYYDVSAPDDADMLPEMENIGLDNPLESFTSSLKASTLGEVTHASVERLLDDNARRALIQEHAPAIAAFEVLMKTERGTWRWPSVFAGTDKKNDFSDAGLALGMSEIMQLKIQLESAGSPEQALRDCVSLIQFGHGLNGAKGTLVHYIAATIIQRNGEICLEQPLTNHPASEETLESILTSLTELEPPREEYRATLRAEYAYIKWNIAAYLRGEEFPESPENKIGGYPPPLDRWFFKPNLTTTMRIDLDRSVIKGLSISWKEALQIRKNGLDDLKARLDSPLRVLINPNTTGILGHRRAVSNQYATLINTINMVATHRQITMQLALRRHELVHGRLPANVSELAPKFLPAFPTDPYSDLPMNWIFARKLVYSIGSDLKDDGGTLEKSMPRQAPDLGMHYWWGESAAAARKEKSAL